MRSKIVPILMGVFFLFLISAVLVTNSKRPHILILHSYSNDYVWTKEVNVGLERILGRQTSLDIQYHFMKTKTRSDEVFLRRAGLAARKTIEKVKPTVLIAMDDYAQSLAAKYYIDHPEIRIVFGGVNGSHKPYNYHKANNVTGIIEQKPFEALREVLVQLSKQPGLSAIPGKPRATFLIDKSLSAARDADHMKEFDWQDVDYQGAVAVGSFRAWQKAVTELAGKTDFLLVGAYRKLKQKGSDKFAPPFKVMTWTEAHSKAPTIGVNVFNSEDGAMLSVGVSPYEQGEVMANMALKLLNPKFAIKDLPVQISKQYVVALRQSALDRRKVKLPKVFESFARATDNYFE